MPPPSHLAIAIWPPADPRNQSADDQPIGGEAFQSKVTPKLGSIIGDFLKVAMGGLLIGEALIIAVATHEVLESSKAIELQRNGIRVEA